MQTIEIDFDVFKKLTVMRESEADSYNDVLRRVLNIGSPSPKRSVAGHNESQPIHLPGSWTTKGVTFPPGTEFRASYKGRSFHGRIEDGALTVNGKSFDSPSAAAVAITGNSVNGWIFWECKKPGAASWQLIKSLRKGL